MAVDKGGLNYRIKVIDEFSRPLGRFRDDTEKARAAFNKLKADMAKPAATGLDEETKKQTRATEAATKAEIRRSRTADQLTRQQKTLARALRELNRESLKRETNQKKAERSARREFQLQRNLDTAMRSRTRAEERVTRALNKQAEQQRILTAIQERGLSNNLRLKAALGVLNTQERRLLATQRARVSAVDKLRAAQAAAANARLAEIRAETRAQEILNRARLRERTDAILRSKGRGDLASKPAEENLTFFQRLGRALTSTDNKANRVSFTFRRLFGILAAFTIARNLIAGFGNLVRTLITANAQIETVTLGIASLLASVAEIRDVQGNAVKGVEALSIAQEEARRQTNLLRIDALKTTATFAELSEVFQIGLGPGLRAGLDIDQIRAFTRQISIAASAIGLEQNQLAEEIRSIFAGTISKRNTRIATTLGITSKDIEQAKEAGNLFEFLQSRFLEFETAGNIAADTFAGLVARVTDSLRNLLAVGGVEFFNVIKDVLRGTIESIQTIDTTTQQIQFNPTLLAAVRLLSTGLADAVRSIQRLAAASGLDSLVTIVAGIGSGIAGAAKVVSALVLGFLDAVKVIKSIITVLNTLGRIVGGVFGAVDADPFLDILKIVGELFTLSIAIQLSLQVFGPLIKVINVVLTYTTLLVGRIFVLLKLQRTVMVGILFLNYAINIPLLIAASIIGAILFSTGLISKALSGISSLLDRLTGSVLKNIKDSVGGITDGTEQKINGIIVAALSGLKEIDDAINALRNNIEDTRAATEAFFKGVDPRNTGFTSDPNNALTKILIDFETISNESRRAKETVERGIKELDTALADLARRKGEIEARIPVLKTNEKLEFYTQDRFEEDKKHIAGFEKRLKESQDRQAIQLEKLRKFSQAGILDVRVLLFRKRVENRLNQELRVQQSIREKIAAIQEGGFAVRAEIAALIEEESQIVGNINASTQQRAEAEQRINDLLRENFVKQVALARVKAEEAIVDERRQAFLREGADLTERLIRQARQRGDHAGLALQLAQQELDQVQRKQLIEERDLLDGIMSLEILRSKVEEQIKFAEARKAAGEFSEQEQDDLQEAFNLQSQITEQLVQQNAALADHQAISKIINEDNQRTRDKEAVRAGGGTFGDQLLLAVDDLQQTLPQKFQFLFDTLSSTVKGFGDFVASTLVDAFDPTSDANIKERFARFLQGISQQVIATLVQLAITSILFNSLSGGILGSLLGSFGRGSVVGKSEGGRIDKKDQRKARAHPAHYSKKARGRARGGAGRPVGLHPTDTIPIWVAANEWVVRASSVAKVGHDAMARINSGMFDPDALRNVLGLGGQPARSAISMAPKAGMVSGGRVREPASQQSSSGSPSTGGVSIAIMAPTEEAVNRFFSGGGRNGLLNAIGNDADEIKARLGL